MMQIQLSAVPNQTFSISLNGNFYDIAIKLAKNIMTSTVSRNNILLQSGLIIVAGGLILPYPYEEDGNFFITTLNDELPIYTEFGVSQFLYYASQPEIVALRAA